MKTERQRRFELRRFECSDLEILPRLAVGREPGCFGYPAVTWVCAAWLRWSFQLSWYHGDRVKDSQFRETPIFEWPKDT